jgi:hypothetical protein
VAGPDLIGFNAGKRIVAPGRSAESQHDVRKAASAHLPRGCRASETANHNERSKIHGAWSEVNGRSGRVGKPTRRIVRAVMLAILGVIVGLLILAAFLWAAAHV